MNFQELLSELNQDGFNNVLEEWNVDKNEQEKYFSFIEHLLTIKPIKTVAELVIDDTAEEIEVGVLEDGCSYAIDFIDWDELLAYTVNKTEIEKITSIEEFVFCVLYDMSFDGFDQETRDENINEIKSRINIDEDKVWYVMLETLQGKHSLLVVEEMYDEEEILLEGYNVIELLQNKKAKIWNEGEEN